MNQQKKKTVTERLKEKLETICFAIVIVGAIVSALAFLATKAEVKAVAETVTINTLQDQLRETNSAIIQTDKQLMWMEQKLAAENKKCELDERWRELRQQLNQLNKNRDDLSAQINAMKGKK